MKYHIIHKPTSVGHPQSNGEAEVTNRTVLKDLKIRIDRAKRSWADDLHSVLWSYRTTPQISIEEIPFKLMFETEAMIPIEISLSST